jgi:hypothetical protein
MEHVVKAFKGARLLKGYQVAGLFNDADNGIVSMGTCAQVARVCVGKAEAV